MKDAERQLLTRTIKFYTSMFGALCNAIYARFGEQGLVPIRTVASQFGTVSGKALKNRIQTDSAEVCAEAQNELFRALGWDIRFEPEGEVIRVVANECPYQLANPSREVCDAAMDFDRSMWQAIDPRLKFHIDKTIADGDKQCICRIKQEA